MDALDAFRLVDLLGVAAGAASGALAARRQDGFDFVGVLGLAFACGLGGGLLRDLLLAKGTPVALTDALYLPTVITAAVVVSVIAGEPGPKILRAIGILDALAVGFFAVASALRAREAGVTRARAAADRRDRRLRRRAAARRPDRAHAGDLPPRRAQRDRGAGRGGRLPASPTR